MWNSISRLFNPASAANTALSPNAPTTATGDAIRRQIALQERDKERREVISGYEARVRFLCASLWPEHKINVHVVDSGQLFLSEVVMSIPHSEGRLNVSYRAEISTREYTPVPREVIAQINMVVG